MKKDKKVKNQERFFKRSAMDRESNITLVSTSVVIISFFALFFLQNATLVVNNVSKAQTLSDVYAVIYLALGVVSAIVAIVKREKFMIEYVIFFIISAIGYYLLLRGASGIPGLITEESGTFTISSVASFFSKFLTTTYITYSLWGLNVLYCIFTIAYHSVRYSKIKNK